MKPRASILGACVLLIGTAADAGSTIKVNFPERPIAPRTAEECLSFEARLQTTIVELYGARQRITDERVREVLATTVIDYHAEDTRYYPAPHCDGGRTYNYRDEAAYDDAICYANALKNDGFTECMREVSNAKSQAATQPGTSLYQTSVLTYGQEAVKTSVDITNNAPKVYQDDDAIAHWVAQASSTKDVYDLAKNLQTLFDGNAPPKERLSAQNDLGLSIAQKLTENPLSQIIMATGVKLIEEHYFKSMSLLEAQLAAFDRAGVGATARPLDIRSLYDDGQLAAIERVFNSLGRFAALGNDRSNTYIGGEISYSARTQPASTANSSYVPPESEPRAPTSQSSGSAFGAAFAGAAQAYIDAQAMRQAQEQVKTQQHPSGRPCWVYNGGKPGGTVDTGGWSTCGSSK